MPLVSLIDDHRLFSASLAIALRGEGFEVDTPRLTSLDEIRHAVLHRRPQVTMLDRDLGPVGDGEALIAPITQAGCPVVVVSAALSDVVAGRCLAAGAAVCLHKTEPFDVLLSAITAVAHGQIAITQGERYKLIDAWRRWQASMDTSADAFSRLTPRESAVLDSLVAGRSVRMIAKESYVSEATVRTHVRGILTKLNVNSQLEAVAMAVRADRRSSGERARGPAA